MKDRNKKLRQFELDKEFLDNESAKLLEEEERHVEELVSMKEDVVDDEIKDIYARDIRLHFIARLFKEREDWKRNLLELREFNVIKMPRVMQSLFYLMEYERDQICEKGTNKFFWKLAKTHLNDEFINRLVHFKVMGPKEKHYFGYKTLNFIERNIEGINPEDVDAYNLTLGKLFKWLLLAIKTRKDDIVRRKALRRKTREDREKQIELAELREKKRILD